MKRNIVFYILGSIILSFIITDMILWIIISSDNSKSFSEEVKEHLSYWPRFIKTPVQSTLIKIALGGISIVLFIGGYVKSKKKFLKRLGLVLIILAGVLTYWEFFSLL